MDSPSIGDEEEDNRVTGRLVFTRSDGNDSDNSTVATPAAESGGRVNKPILETGKTWLSKLSSSSSSALNIRSSSHRQSVSDTESMTSYLKPLGHWPDLLVMDPSENYQIAATRRIKGK